MHNGMQFEKLFVSIQQFTSYYLFAILFSIPYTYSIISIAGARVNIYIHVQLLFVVIVIVITIIIIIMIVIVIINSGYTRSRHYLSIYTPLRMLIIGNHRTLPPRHFVTQYLP